jgi:hypothetical protein
MAGGGLGTSRSHSDDCRSGGSRDLLIAMMTMGVGRHRTVIDDGQGNVVRRDDTYI